MKLNRDVFSTIIVMSSTFFSRIMGFVKIKVFSYYFGADLEADIFNYVFNIPNNLRKIISEGAMTSAFMPEFTYERNKSNDKAVNFFRTVMTFNIISISLIIFIMIIFSKEIMYYLSSYRGNNLITASSMFNYLIMYILLISLASILSSVLNSYKIFFIPSFSPIMLSVGMAISIIFLYRSYGIYSAVIGVLVGGAFQFIVQLLNCYFIGFTYKPLFGFKDKTFLHFLSRWSHMILASLIAIITQQISFTLASNLEVGSISVLSNAIVYYQLPVGIFYVSISTVIFPKMSEYAALGNKKKLDSLFNYGIEILILLLLPASFLMYIWAPSILNLFLFGGKFSFYDTERTSSVLQYFLIGLLFSSIFGFFQKYYFSIRDSKTPLFLGILFSVIDISISVFGVKFYGVNALAMAQSIAFIFCVIVFYFFSLKDKIQLDLLSIFVTILKALISLIPMYLVYYFFIKIKWDVGFSLYNFFILSLAGTLSTVLLVFFYYLINVKQIFKFIKREIV